MPDKSGDRVRIVLDCHLFIHLKRFTMKIALMILFVWGGFTITSINAQSCKPCPPACCKAVGCEPGKSSAGVNQSATTSNALVVFSPETLASCSPDNKVSKAEMKGCQVSCAPACSPATAAKGQTTAKPLAVNYVAPAAPKPIQQ